MIDVDFKPANRRGAQNNTSVNRASSSASIAVPKVKQSSSRPASTSPTAIPEARTSTGKRAESTGNSSDQTSSGGAKRQKRDSSIPLRLTKEDKELYEEKMQLAIKMAQDTRNVVLSATTYEVATSTLRGRLKKLGYTSAPKAPTATTEPIANLQANAVGETVESKSDPSTSA